jgi:8-amino-7-oxononanoate synthase
MTARVWKFDDELWKSCDCDEMPNALKSPLCHSRLRENDRYDATLQFKLTTILNQITVPNLDHQLTELDSQKLLRKRCVVSSAQGTQLVVDGKAYLSFCSNDYLGLANHPSLVEAFIRGAREFGVGGAASHLISGHMAPHEALEIALAKFVGLPRALYFSCGYAANSGVIPALADRGDGIFSDALNHACIIDGARLSRAEVQVYPHADVATLTKLLAVSNAERKLVVSDAVFSMDGDIAPVTELLALCEQHDAWLLLDDAHGFGVLGANGRGVLEHFDLHSPNIIYMGTLGKAAGASGAFVAGQTDVIEWLVQRARTYVFSTASPPAIAVALQESLRIIAQEPWRREHLRTLAARLREGLKGLAWTLLPSQTAIQPLVIGENQTALDVMARLQETGIWVPAIRPPTVPAGTARLRISLSASHSIADVDRLVAALIDISR